MTDRGSGVFCETPIDVDGIRRRESDLYAVFVFPTAGIVDRSSFFSAVKSTLPLDPPVMGNHVWDALSDSLWQGLYELPQRRIAIVWPGAQAMGDGAPADFEIALSVLTDVTAGLADTRATLGRTKEVAVFVECQVSRPSNFAAR